MFIIISVPTSSEGFFCQTLFSLSFCNKCIVCFMLTQSITPIPAMKKALSWGVFFYFCQHCLFLQHSRDHTDGHSGQRRQGAEGWRNTLPTCISSNQHSSPSHISLCRPLPYPLCLSRLTHPYDNLCTIKSPNGPQVCQHASVTNKRNAFKRTEALRCLWESNQDKKHSNQNLEWQLRIQRGGNYIRLSIIKITF